MNFRAVAMRPLALGVLALATGCALGPDYERPDVKVGRDMPEIAPVVTASDVRFTENEPWARWWEVFKDPELEKLVAQAREANQDLRAAFARVQIARSIFREAFAPLLPTIGGIGAYQYVKLPPLVGNQGGQAASGPFSGQPFQAFAGLGSLSYEFDVWGRVRRQLEGANAQETASEEDRKAVELAVTADVAQAYFDLGEGDAELAIARESVTSFEETLAIVRKRQETGFATELELRRAEGALAAARAEIPQAEERRAVAEHRLAILTGRMPTLHFAGRPPAEFEVPPEIPLGVPAALLERRPDIRAAEANLATRNASVGQAIAGYFPSLTIQGFAGYTALGFNQLTNPNSQFWAAGPILRIPLFQGGLVYAQVQEAEARTSEAEANYRSVILRAFGEIADSVVRISADQRIRDQQVQQVEAGRRALDLAKVQYEQGLTLYLDVLDSQRVLLAARQSLVRTQRQLLFDIVQLARALGGGWTELPRDEFQEKLIEPFVPPDKEGHKGARPE